MGFFLNPWMLFGALAASAPIIIHLMNRQKYKRVAWAAMEFLLNAYRKTRRRLRIEEWLLLAIRTLALLLIAMALARPFFHKASAAVFGEDQIHRILLMDASYSMGYRQGSQTLFAKAREAADFLIEDLEGRGAVTILKLADPLQQVVLAERRTQDAKRELDAVQLSQTDCSMAEALQRVPKLFEEVDIARRELFLLTDLQRHGWPQGAELQDPKLQEAVQGISEKADVYLYDVGVPQAENLQLLEFRPVARHIGLNRPTQLEVRIVNRGGPRQELVLDLYEGTGPQKEKRASENLGRIEAGEEKAHTFVYSFNEEGSHGLTVSASPDGLPIDDSRYLTVDVKEKLKVLMIDGEPGAGGTPYEDETYLLKKSLAFSEEAPFHVEVRSAFGFTDSDLIDFSQYEAVVLTNLDTVAPGQIGRLETYVRDGGALVIWLGDRTASFASSEFYNEQLYRDGEGLLPFRSVHETVGFEEGSQEWFKLSAEKSHPLFAGSRSSWPGFESAYIRRFQKVSLPEKGENPEKTEEESAPRVMLRFSDDDLSPAMVEKKFGRGRVVGVTTAADLEWGDFPVNPYYVILNHELMYYLIETTQRTNVKIGEQISTVLPAEFAGQPMRIVRPEPDSSVEAVAPTAEGNKAHLSYPESPSEFKTDISGLYKLEIGATGEKKEFFAVNLHPEEGNLSRLEETELKQLFPKISWKVSSSIEEFKKQVTQEGVGKEFWRPLMYAVLFLLCAETLMAWWFGQRGY